MTYCAWCMGAHAWCTLASKLVSIRGLRCSFNPSRIQTHPNAASLREPERLCSSSRQWHAAVTTNGRNGAFLFSSLRCRMAGFVEAVKPGAASLCRRTKFTSCCASALGRGTKCCASRAATLLCLGAGARKRCTYRSVVSSCMPYLVRPFAAMLPPLPPFQVQLACANWHKHAA